MCAVKGICLPYSGDCQGFQCQGSNSLCWVLKASHCHFYLFGRALPLPQASTCPWSLHALVRAVVLSGLSLLPSNSLAKSWHSLPASVRMSP